MISASLNLRSAGRSRRTASAFAGSMSAMFVRSRPFGLSARRAVLNASPKTAKPSGRWVAGGSWKRPASTASVWSNACPIASSSEPFGAIDGLDAQSSISGPASIRQRPKATSKRMHFVLESALILILLGGLQPLLGRKMKALGPPGTTRKPQRWIAPSGPQRDRQRGGRCETPPRRPRCPFVGLGSRQCSNLRRTLVMRCPYTVKPRDCQGKVRGHQGGGEEGLFLSLTVIWPTH